MGELNQFRVLVSIVNYRSAELVCQMLPDLIRQIDESKDRIVIVDNQSPDDSFKILNDFVNSFNFNEYVDVVLADKNGGFSYGNNLAIKTTVEKYQITPSYVWLLNPDTKLLENALSNLFKFFDEHPKAGILGSRLESEDGELQGSAFRFHTLKSELLSGLRLGITDNLFSKYLVSPKEIPAEPTQVDWLAGASMLIRYSVIEDIGLMDETYFLYYEETDFCLQAHKFGWQSWYVPLSRIIHYVGQSTGVVSGDSLRRRRPKYWFQSRQYYLRKNHGIIYTALADLAWGGMFTVHKVLDFIRLRFHNDPMYLWRDFWRNSIFLSWLDGKGSRMFENIKQDWKANSKSINHAGFRTLIVYRFGRWRMTIKNKALRAPLSFLYRLMEKHIRFKYGIELPYTVELGKSVTFEHQHGIVIHGQAKIGDGCIIRQGVTIGNKSLDAPFDAPVIGSYVNIGAGAKILGRVHLGNYSAIGANAVVTSDIPDYAVAVGIPAKVIRIQPSQEQHL